MTRGGTAVMASRKAPSIANKLQFFPTPPWAMRALLNYAVPGVGLFPTMTAWEPACGGGHCALPMREFFEKVYCTDVHDWGYGAVRDLDFSFCGPADAPYPIDWVITNPPFSLAEMFARRGLEIARHGVALLVRLQWLEGGDRYHQFFAPNAPMRPTLIVQFSERVPMIEGAWDPQASSATAYCWIIWVKDEPAPGLTIPIYHLPPGMEALYTRPEDGKLASPGEAARRAIARKQAEAEA